MLATTAPNVREYCRRHCLGYESFVGIKRGFHPWQATFNRIPMLAELVERGFTGWALYLDADAWIQDLDFDLPAYLADKQDRAAIFATSGVTGEPWDVNAGVALINLGHPLGRELVAQWAAGFAGHSDDDLRAGDEWFGGGNDQDLLHQILQRDSAIAGAVLVEQMSFLNGPHARFIRQQLRALSPSLEDRLRTLSEAVTDVFRRDGRVAVMQPSTEDDRWSARFAHSDLRQPLLMEAPVPVARIDILPAVMSAWARASGPASEGAVWDGFTDALTRQDANMAAARLAGLGRADFAQGFLGGARQHERARDRGFADRLARWTYDKLLSLSEAVGAVRLENPENGSWGGNPRIDPARLFGDVEAALGIDLTPPASIGGHLGIDVGGGRIVHMRMLDAIHAAWRLRQMADALGLGGQASIAEIGGGAGLTAYYAATLGVSRYWLFDTPVMSAVQAYVLQDVTTATAVGSIDALAGIEPGSIDILFNTDTLPSIERCIATNILRDARRIGVHHMLSINSEAELPGRTAVAELVRDAHGYRLASRHRHWLRTGYVEEHYIGIGEDNG
ncbi:hypothetical protein WP12_05670 [Sphingomonas sp. SRS2]|nr:hypothetical protein WP12_05670 [Sphingomonas sp. SRS2]